MRPSPSRRSFVKTIVGTGIAVPAVMSQLQAQESKEKLRVAFIGVGGIGGTHLNEFSKEHFPNIEATALCEVDTARVGQGAKLWPNAKTFQDYREMFDKSARDFDGVIIGTPDHHHYPATVLAMKAGKHCYTQKPLTHTVWESRQLGEMAKTHKLATQMGNQGHAGDGWRAVYGWIKSGAIGDVKEAHTWTNRPIWPTQGMSRPEGEDPVPSTLNWDVWIGPAPMRPFKKDIYHHFAWRGWWDFGAGALGDMAAHTMDGVFWALEAFDPIACEPIAMTPMGGGGETFPKASVIKWTFPEKADRPAFNAYWYDGGLKPQRPPELEPTRQLPETGNLFIGTKATIMVSGDYGNSPRIIPETKSQEIGRPPQLIERAPARGNYAEWYMAATGQKPLDFCKSNFTYAGPMCEVMILGNVALKMGQRLEWDRANCKVTNLPEANRFVNKEYREGWKF